MAPKGGSGLSQQSGAAAVAILSRRTKQFISVCPGRRQWAQKSYQFNVSVTVDVFIPGDLTFVLFP